MKKSLDDRKNSLLASAVVSEREQLGPRIACVEWECTWKESDKRYPYSINDTSKYISKLSRAIVEILSNRVSYPRDSSLVLSSIDS